MKKHARFQAALVVAGLLVARTSGWGDIQTKAAQHPRSILVGEVVSTDSHDAPHEHIQSLQLKVLMDQSDEIKPKELISLQAVHPVPGIMDDVPNIPTVQKGAVLVCIAEHTKDQRVFDYLDQRLPFGLHSGEAMPPQQMEDLTAALRAFSWSDMEDKPNPKRAEAWKLLKEKNYYLWALGIWRLVHGATREDIAALTKLFTAEKLSLRQAIWLDEMLGDIRPAENESPYIAPTEEEMHRLLRDYLKERIAQETSPTKK